ncbi:limbin isoform X1 [Ambystoma mexicanum]|uniref:limbin isoform X1 n=1 Tax=Ambystoma mexicanum TaxID=8296 RepID=UPI0037E7DEBA
MYPAVPWCALLLLPNLLAFPSSNCRLRRLRLRSGKDGRGELSGCRATSTGCQAPGRHCYHLPANMTRPDFSASGQTPNKPGHRSTATSKEALQDLTNWTFSQECRSTWRALEKPKCFSKADCTFLGGGEGAAFLPPPLTSAASGRLWSQSLFSFVPSWTKKIVFKRESFNQPGRDSERTAASTVYGLIFEKCAVVNSQNDPQTALVILNATNANSSSSASDVSDLVIQDGITSLIVKENGGSNTGNGYQTYRSSILKAGDSFVINYTAALNASASPNGKILSLPAVLSFTRASQGSQRFSLEALFNIAVTENPQVTPHHGLHAVGFAVALFVSFVLTCIIFIAIHQCRGSKCFLKKNQEHSFTPRESRLDPSQLEFADSKIEDLVKSDRILDILAFEESENMPQALKDNEIAQMTQADAHLEACRMHIAKDVIGILLRNMVFNNSISLQGDKGFQASIKDTCSKTEKSLREEYERKMVALAAECNLETRREMDVQQHRHMGSKQELEEMTKLTGEKSAMEYRTLLEQLHQKEQNQMTRLLLLKQEEEFVKVHRQLALSQRTSLHETFFKQVQDAVYRRELKKDAARTLVNDYSEAQEKIEDLMDFFEEIKKHHLAKRFACRKYMAYQLQMSETKTRCLLNTASTQIAILINKMQSTGHVTEHQSEALLDQAQTEVHSVKQKLDNALKNEKRKLHQKLVANRSRQLQQKLKEQRKELVSVDDTFKTAKDVAHYLNFWRKLFTDHSQEFEDLAEKLDGEATEEFTMLKCSLTDKATNNLRSIQHVVIMQALLKVPVPRILLQQALEEHKQELALCTQQLENEEYEKNGNAKVLLQNTKQKLGEDLWLNLKEQKSLRSWEQLVFQKIVGLPLVLSDEELLPLKQVFHCGFSQMDRSLALPVARARLLQERSQSAWRKQELLKANQYLPAQDKPNPKMNKQFPQDKRIDVLKRSLEDKLCIYEENITEDQIKQVHRELLLERVQQLKGQEARLGEYIASLQYRKSAEKAKDLEIRIAIINLQALLVEDLCTSRTLTVSECTQLLQEHHNETEELYRKVELEASQTASIQHHDFQQKKQGLGADSLEVYNEVEEDMDRHTTALLRRALLKRQRIMEHQRVSIKEEEMCSVLSEGQREKMEMESCHTLHQQELRLAAFLAKQATVPVEMMYRILNLLLPSSSDHEILSVLNAGFQNNSGGNIETDGNSPESDGGRKRNPQDSGKALETRLRQSLINQGLEKTNSSIRRKGSILKKKRLMPVKRVSFSHIESLSKLPAVVPYGLSKTNDGNAAAESGYTDREEKLFVFRSPKESTFESSKSTKKKKKRNFLNLKKSSIANLEQ